MGWLSKIFSGGAGELVEKAGNLFTKAQENHLGKKELKLELEKLISAENDRIHNEVTAELGAKERVLVAELAQGDAFTKRARPMVVYTGLAVLVLNHVVLPWSNHFFTTNELPTINIPIEFWIGWSGIVATWSIGRDAVRKGIKNKFTQIASGPNAKSIFD
jgi:hypothetical protein